MHPRSTEESQLRLMDPTARGAFTAPGSMPSEPRGEHSPGLPLLQQPPRTRRGTCWPYCTNTRSRPSPGTLQNVDRPATVSPIRRRRVGGQMWCRSPKPQLALWTGTSRWGSAIIQRGEGREGHQYFDRVARSRLRTHLRLHNVAGTACRRPLITLMPQTPASNRGSRVMQKRQFEACGCQGSGRLLGAEREEAKTQSCRHGLFRESLEQDIRMTSSAPTVLRTPASTLTGMGGRLLTLPLVSFRNGTPSQRMGATWRRVETR
jgi:hypothetical protein